MNDKTGDTSCAVVGALSRTGRLVTSAALILAISFLSLSTNPDLPVVVVQNNYSRLQDTAMGADVLGVDPYPVPNVSLRAVPDATKAAARRLWAPDA